MRIWIVAALAAVLAASPARAGVLADAARDCPDLTACMAALDRVTPRETNGATPPDAPALAETLSRFGRPARAALLTQATSGHPGWRNLARAVLAEWRDFGPDDVALLSAALKQERGSWATDPLGRIGTPEAISVLVADLGEHDRTEFILQRLGAEALPYLLPLLETDNHRRPYAERVISRGDTPPAAVIAEWARTAASPAETQARRTAALRALRALGPRARAAADHLHPLLQGTPPWLHDLAFSTLRSLKDPLVVPTLATDCRPSATRFDPYPHAGCVSELAAFGDDALPAAPSLVRFLDSTNGEERATAAVALGYIGHRGAVPALVRALQSPDWREVYVAARSLGWLGAAEALPELDRTAAEHWLPEVRHQAVRAADALRGPDERLARPTEFGSVWSSEIEGELEGEPETADAYALGEPPACVAGRWRWENQTFDFSRSDSVPSLKVGGGRLIGTDEGEWGGALSWRPAHGPTRELVDDNTPGLAAAPDGAVALVGLAHLVFNYGYVLRLTPDDTSGWRLVEVGTLPGRPGELRVLGPALYAVLSEERAVVFTPERILGLAACAD